MRKKKFYVVIKGRHPGIYETWTECKREVDGYKGAQYQSFECYEDAERFYHSDGSVDDDLTFEKPKSNSKAKDATFFVDGSYSSDIGVYGYGVVCILPDGSIHTAKGAGNTKNLRDLRNVAGEMIGAMYAVQLAIKNGFKKISIHYDYMGIENWVTGEWRTKTEYTRKYAESMQKWQREVDIEFVKVKGHSGDKYNDMVDGLAKEAVKEFRDKSK